LACAARSSHRLQRHRSAARRWHSSRRRSTLRSQVASVDTMDAMEVTPKLTLTELEQQVFKALLETVNHFSLGTTLRAAGGWVRDKVLGTCSDDIDIVVDNMSGEEFALKVTEYMTQNAESNMVSTVGVVKQNPDQSKHLATACFRLYGLSLDVNNLRTETYTEDSRIPVTAIGTPAEDAQRRDFTTNALFYNITVGEIEDFTGHGLSDLRDGLIRTPLPASETFRDDPLRMLRALRFAARLDFRLDDSLLSAASDAQMHQLLETKVSRERFGIEVDKMMKAKGQRPVVALEMMRQTGMLAPVFVPQEIAASVPSGKAELEQGVERASEAAGILLADCPGEELRLLMYAALMSSWAEKTIPEKKKQRPLIPQALRASLKIDMQSCEAAQDIAAAAVALHGGRGLTGTERSHSVGSQLRIVQERWPQALALSEIIGGDKGDDARQAFARDRQWLADSGLVGCWEWKPLIDGKQLMADPYNVPKGKRVGEVMDLQLRWRLEQPSLTLEECAKRVHELLASSK